MKLFFELTDFNLVKVKDAGRQNSIRAAGKDSLNTVLDRPRTATGNNGNADGIINFLQQLNIKAFFGAVSLHAGQQNFSGSAALGLFRSLDSIKAGIFRSALRKDFPVAVALFGVNGRYDALRAKTVGRMIDQAGIANNSAVHRYFVSTGVQQFFNLIGAADAAAHGKGNAELFGDAADQRYQGFALFFGGGNIEEDQLVGALLGIAARQLHRIAGIAQAFKIHPFNGTPVFNVQAGDDTFSQRIFGIFVHLNFLYIYFDY